MLRPSEARDRLRTLAPVPHLPDRRAALASLEKALQTAPDASVIYLSDGIDLADEDGFAADLKRVVGDHPLTTLAGGVREPLALAAADNGVEALTVKVVARRPRHLLARRHGACARHARPAARRRRRSASSRAPARPRPASRLPVEIRNEVARLEVVDEHSAGAVAAARQALAPPRGRPGLRRHRRPAPAAAGALLLSHPRARPVRRSAPVRRARHVSEAIERFIDQKLPVIVLSDIGTIPPETHDRLARWIEGGGVLIRFAGPRLANGSDDLVPVMLRRGGRVLGGSLSWEQPQ